jgi:disulfide oxidoreductase YuzD
MEYCSINMPEDEKFKKFEIVLWGISKISYILRAPTVEDTKDWIKALRSAKVKFMNQRFGYQIPNLNSTRPSITRQQSNLSSEIKNEEYQPSFHESYYQDDKIQENIIIEMTEVKGKLIGGSVEKIVEKLCDEVFVDTSTIFAFLLTMHSLLEPAKLFDILVSYYFKPPKSLVNKQEKGNIKAQLRIIAILTKWIEVHLRDFIQDRKLLQNLVNFSAKLENTQFTTKLNNTIKKVCGMAGRKKITTTENKSIPSILPTLFNGSEFDFFDFNVIEIARQFCLTEFEIFKNIHPKEFHNQGIKKKKKIHLNKKIESFHQIIPLNINLFFF